MGNPALAEKISNVSVSSTGAANDRNTPKTVWQHPHPFLQQQQQGGGMPAVLRLIKMGQPQQQTVRSKDSHSVWVNQQISGTLGL